MGKLQLVVNNTAEPVSIPQTAEEYARFVEKALCPPPDVMRIFGRSGRSGLRDEQGRRISPRSLKGMFISQAGLCCYCCEPMTLPNPRKASRPDEAQVVNMLPTDVTRDHLRPKSEGNPGTMFNLAAACRACNTQKADMPLLMFMLARRNGNVADARRRYQQHKRNGQLRQA